MIATVRFEMDRVRIEWVLRGFVNCPHWCCSLANKQAIVTNLKKAELVTINSLKYRRTECILFVLVKVWHAFCMMRDYSFIYKITATLIIVSTENVSFGTFEV